MFWQVEQLVKVALLQILIHWSESDGIPILFDSGTFAKSTENHIFTRPIKSQVSVNTVAIATETSKLKSRSMQLARQGYGGKNSSSALAEQRERLRRTFTGRILSILFYPH